MASQKYVLLLMFLVSTLSGCSSNFSANEEGPTEPLVAPTIPSVPEDEDIPENQSAKLFWLEPSESTTIGVGQVINIYTALKSQASDSFPKYLSATDITWTNTSSSVASISTSGSVTGLSEGTTTIVATYQEFKSQINIKVSGMMISRTVSVVGQGSRKYYIYIPKFSDLVASHPLLISLHGGGGTAMLQAASSQLNETASSENFYVVYPEGSGAIQTFNAGACCGYAKTNNIDDVLFIRTLISDVEALYKINSAKIFSTGFSNGAILSHRLACELADKIAGVVPVSGGSGEFDYQNSRYFNCQPSRPIPILHIHSNNDRNYAFEGGLGEGVSATDFYPIPSTINDWIQRNNLTSQFTVEQVSPLTKCYHYATIANPAKLSAPVTLCKLSPVDIYDTANEIVFGGGHSWPGGVRSPSLGSDTPFSEFKANTYLWNFLQNK